MICHTVYTYDTDKNDRNKKYIYTEINYMAGQMNTKCTIHSDLDREKKGT